MPAENAALKAKRELALHVHDLVQRRRVLKHWQQVVAAWSSNLARRDKLKAKRQQLRDEYVAMHGWLYPPLRSPKGQVVPTQEPGQDFWMSVFRGSIRLPTRLRNATPSEKAAWLTEHASRFPRRFTGTDSGLQGEEYFPFALAFAAWLPPELALARDPDDSRPFPLPDRELRMPEGYAALAAIHDVRPRGTRIGPLEGSRGIGWAHFHFLKKAVADLSE